MLLNGAKDGKDKPSLKEASTELFRASVTLSSDGIPYKCRNNNYNICMNIKCIANA